MTTFFYLIALFYLIYEIDYILNIKKRIADRDDTGEIIEKYRHLGWRNSPKEYKHAIYSGAIGLIVIAYDFTGLLTDQRFSFLCFIAYDLIILSAVKSMSKNETFYFWVVFFNTLIQILFTLFIIVNHYHLHIDTFQLFKAYFGI